MIVCEVSVGDNFVADFGNNFDENVGEDLCTAMDFGVDCVRGQRWIYFVGEKLCARLAVSVCALLVCEKC